MKIFNSQTKALLFDSKAGGNLDFNVTPEFWAQLVDPGIVVCSGGKTKDNDFYTLNGKLQLKDKNFIMKFAEFAETTIGMAMMLGELPPETIA